MFNIGDKFEIKISGIFVIEGGIFYAAEGIKDYLFDEDELKQLIGNSEGISVGDECRKTGRRSEKILKLLEEMQSDKKKADVAEVWYKG